MRSKTVTIIRYTVSLALVLAIAFGALLFRVQVTETILQIWTYVVGSVTILGQVIPQQILWFFLLLILLHVAVGSMYGKDIPDRTTSARPRPIQGPVERLAGAIDHRQRGTYFNWQIANLLGRIERHLRESASPVTSNRLPPPDPQIRAYLDAGLQTTYADHPTPGWFRWNDSVFDVPLEQVVDYIEENMEIRHERKN